MDGESWGLLVERATHTKDLAQRVRIWMEAIDQPGGGPEDGPLTVYSPPEYTGAVDFHGTPAAHVYSLGVLGHAVLAGEVPWRGIHARALRRKILTERLPEISHAQWPAAFQGRINRVIARATEKNPAARYPDPAELRAEVAGALTSLERDHGGQRLEPRIHRAAYHYIEQWLDRARAGSAPALEVVGASGIGKTYLWETVHDTRALPGERWLYVKARQVSDRPYETITLLFESVRTGIETVLSTEHISPPVWAFLHAVAPHIVPAGGSADASDVRNPAGELARLILRFVGAEAFRVICFDDFQWVDPYSRRVIAELASSPPGTGLVILTREELSRSIPTERVRLHPLSREVAREFVGSQHQPFATVTAEAFERAFSLSAGNPMVLQSVLRTGTRHVSPSAQDVLGAVASERLANVTPLCRSVLSAIALVGAPTPLAMFVRYGGFTEDEVRSAVQEAEYAGLVYRNRLHDSVRFSHDSIESAAREGAATDRDTGRRAIRVLIADARGGNDRAAYTAISLLSTVPTEDIVQYDWDWVLAAAARRAVRSLAPAEALRIVETWHDRASRVAQPQLYLIAHEAAYLMADRHAMSRYYRAITGSGDAEAAAEARYLWIRRCYADARFPGAVAVGVRILSEATVITESFQWSSDGSKALRFLQRHTPRQVLAVILRRGYTTDRAVRRVTDTLGRMLLPVLTTDRDHLIHIAYYALRIGMERGATPLTAFGFMAWVLYLGTRRTPGRWVEEYMTCAERLSELSGDRIADHSVRMLCVGFGAPWTGSYRAFTDRLERLQREGREVGNWEFTGHALHLHRQGLLYRGEPLPRVGSALDESRRETRAYGLVRTDFALSKHHAATETLLGRSGDPVSLDGTIVDERAYFERVVAHNDQMSLAGLRTVKALLAIYADRPEEVFEQLTKIEAVVPAMSLFHEHLFIRFYLGLAAYRLNRPEVGSRMLRIVRWWARENPATHRHRVLCIRAERAALRGKTRIARRLLDRAFPLALREGFFNEAALIAERAGDITGVPRYWMVAESAYRQWGAVHAVARVSRKLGRPRASPTSIQEIIPSGDLHRDLIQARSVEDAMETIARHFFVTTPAAHVVIAFRSDPADFTYAYRWTGTDVALDGAPSSDLSLILSETPPDEVRLLSAEDVLRSGHSGVVGRSHSVHDSEVAALLVAAADGAPYAQAVVETVRSVLHLAVLYGALLAARSRISTGEYQLRETRQQLSATERYRRQLFATVTDAFLLMDHAGTVRFSNPAAEPFLDHTAPSTPTLRNDLRVALHTLVDSSIARSRGTLRHRTDDHRHVQIQAAPVGADDEDLVAVSISDITETIDRETQLAQQERQLVVADRLASIGMFSASIVHEISNPNHILQLNTQSLLVVLSWLRSEIDDEVAAATVAQAGDLVEQIEDAARRVESVLQMVKSYSREGRREQWGVREPDDVCARAFRFSKIMASQYTDHFRLAVDPDVGQVWGEAALLEQALVNLIKNACEALPARDGRVELHAYRGTRSADNGATPEVVLAVCDTGTGFSPDLVETVGTPFASGRSDEGGTGLGLSIVSGIVDKHGGYVRVTGDNEFTTRVEIHLPMYTGAAQ
ncbi:MAG: ATP-binding protein [Alkalispirochaeta sp.]